MKHFIIRIMNQIIKCIGILTVPFRHEAGNVDKKRFSWADKSWTYMDNVNEVVATAMSDGKTEKEEAKEKT